LLLSGRGQLLHLDEHRNIKEKIYKRYKESLKDLPLKMNPYLECSKSNFWLSCMLIDRGVKVTPEQIRLKLENSNIEARPIWKPMHLQPVFKGCDYVNVEGDVGGDIFERGLCLPSDIKMTVEQQNKVIELLKSCF